MAATTTPMPPTPMTRSTRNLPASTSPGRTSERIVSAVRGETGTSVGMGSQSPPAATAFANPPKDRPPTPNPPAPLELALVPELELAPTLAPDEFGLQNPAEQISITAHMWPHIPQFCWVLRSVSQPFPPNMSQF